MTSKELAKKLGISEAAVSLALNNKPGVSTKTRNMIKQAAEAAGMDLTKMNDKKNLGVIYLIYYKKHGAVLADTSFFSELTDGVENRCSSDGYRVNIMNIYTVESLQQQLEELSHTGVSGVVLLGTEMQADDKMALAFADLPIVLLDNHFISSKIDSVQINNIDGAYTATNYLIGKCKQHPGFLASSYAIHNFIQRQNGFNDALVHNGMSVSSTIIHQLSPSVDGAYNDMKEILKNGDDLAPCYFADNDLIAIGAIRAFKEFGYRIPNDISIIGFDDIPMFEYTEPGLTTVHVPKQYMGMMAADRLLYIINARTYYPINIEISTHLVVRSSV